MVLVTLLLSGATLIAILVSVATLYIQYQRKYQKKHFESQGMLFHIGRFSDLFRLLMGKLSVVDLEQQLYDVVRKTGKPVIGVFDLTTPMYYVTDLELMKHIYVKDFDHFMNRRTFAKADSDIFTKMLFNMEGEEWKAMRSKMSPTFTTGKIRRMFNIFEKSSSKMCSYLKTHVGGLGNEFDLSKVYAKYATDVIAWCCFAIDSECFERGPDQLSLFEQMAAKFKISLSAKMMIKFIFVSTFPKLANRFNIRPMDAEPQEYFNTVIKDVIKRRRETGEKQDDFLQLLMEAQEDLLKNSEEESKETLEVMTGTASGDANNVFSSTTKLKFDDSMLVANCALFLLAGFDTLQSLLLFATYALAREPEVQEKLFQEVNQGMEENGGKLTYDAMNQMAYLDMFINETLRFYPAASRAERICTKDYTFPGTEWKIKKGQLVVLPIYGLHHDGEFYDNPEKFDPERFQKDRKAKLHPYVYSPFGQGPRNCIGMRFALIEVKALICHLVQNFKLEPCSKTDIPPRYATHPTLRPANGMWLNVSPRAGA